MSVLENMMTRIRVESETKTSVEVTAYEALVLDAKLFELKQLVDDQRRFIDFLRVKEKAKERAAVVAWLRDCALDPETTGAEMRLFQNLAITIERGEHRKEVE